MLWGLASAPPALAQKLQDARTLDAQRGAMQLASRASSEEVVAALDLCAPCTDSGQCLSSICPTDPNGDNGICLQACDAAGQCPPNFSCNTPVDGAVRCEPNDGSVCPNPYRAPKNVFCRYPSTSANPEAIIDRQCADGLTCYHFPAASGATEVGVCVTRCSSTDASAACAPEESCCFGTNNDGSCNRSSTASTSVGGCFVEGDVGASCATADHSYCAKGATCVYPEVAAAAACYGTCGSGGGCPPGGFCAHVGNSDVCCNAKTLNLNDLTTCQPLQGICRREVGVACSENAECRLGTCQKNGRQSACSVACKSDLDCPAEDVDVNGDGVPDGGSTCLDFGGVQRCWPTNGPVTPPRCAIVSDADESKPGQGCQCAGGESSAAAVLVPLALVWRRARRRLRCAWR